MLGKTNATTSSGGGGGGSDKTYGVKLAYEYMQDLLDNSVIKADAVCLDVLDRGGSPARLSGSWTYKPADLSEYMQDILTGDNVAAGMILDTVIDSRQPEETIVAEKTSGYWKKQITQEGYYYIVCVGAGGGGAASGADGTGAAACSGSAGGGFAGTVYLDKGELIINVGTGGTAGVGGGDTNSKGGDGGASYIYLNGENVVTCTGGGGGHAWWRGSYEIGAGGSVTLGEFTVKNQQIAEDIQGTANIDQMDASIKATCSAPLEALGYDYGRGGTACGIGVDYYWETEAGVSGYVLIQRV